MSNMRHMFTRSPEDVLTTAEVAERLGVSTRTVNRWATEGRLSVMWAAPGIRGTRFYWSADVDALAAELAGKAS